MINLLKFTLFKKLLFISIGLGAVGYLLLCISLVIWQNKLIFFPSRVIQTTPEDFGLSYQDIWLPVASIGGKVEHLHGWWIPASSSPKGVILYLHGNGVNVGANVEHAGRFNQLGFSVLLIDYRGYGRSEGNFPTEKQVYQDAEAAWQYLVQQRQIKPQDIMVYGHSLGGAIAVHLASHHSNMAGLIIESSFTSMRDMVVYQKQYRVFPVDLLLTQKFDSISKIKSLSMPMLFIHGTADRTVPALMSQILYDAATARKQILIVPDAYHNNVATVAGDRYLQTVSNFYEKVVSPSATL